MHPTRDAGSVTAETAVALPALVVVAVLGAWLLAAVAAEVRCVDAARIGARAVARGETPAAARAVAASAAPRGASVRVVRSGGAVTVEVSARVGPPLPGVRAVRVHAATAAPMEDDTAPVAGPVSP